MIEEAGGLERFWTREFRGSEAPMAERRLGRGFFGTADDPWIVDFQGSQR